MILDIRRELEENSSSKDTETIVLRPKGDHCKYLKLKLKIKNTH